MQYSRRELTKLSEGDLSICNAGGLTPSVMASADRDSGKRRKKWSRKVSWARVIL